MKYVDWLRYRGCDRKALHYSTAELARKAAMLLYWAGRPAMGWYECGHCGWWHLSKDETLQMEREDQWLL